MKQTKCTLRYLLVVVSFWSIAVSAKSPNTGDPNLIDPTSLTEGSIAIAEPPKTLRPRDQVAVLVESAKQVRKSLIDTSAQNSATTNDQSSGGVSQ